MRKPKAHNFEIGKRIHVTVRRNSIEFDGEIVATTDSDLVVKVDGADRNTSIPFFVMDTLIDNHVNVVGSNSGN